jgi:uncharacterized iron-regulated membrane protein
VSFIKVVRPGGFDWGDAAIGAAGASLMLALVAGLALLVARRSRATAPAEQTKLAGA